MTPEVTFEPELHIMPVTFDLNRKYLPEKRLITLHDFIKLVVDVYNNTWWNLIADYLFRKNRKNSSFKLSVSYEKDTTKDSEAKQLIKPWSNRTKPREIRYLKQGTVANSAVCSPSYTSYCLLTDLF